MSAHCKLRPLGLALLLGLAGCLPAPPARKPATIHGAPATTTPATAADTFSASRNLGQPYQVDPALSLLVVLVYPDGRLAGFGHAHVIASHELAGTVYLPQDPRQVSARLTVPVATLTVDEPQLRAAQGGEFAAEVPQAARDGTRHNMLGPALLDVTQYPTLELVAGGDCAARGQVPGAAPALAVPQTIPHATAGTVPACVTITIRGATRVLALPLRWQLSDGALTVTGETAVRQSDLGLAPFSALLGALQVRDELQVRLRLLARRAVTAP